ncbi:MAG: hypothetical protein FWF38_03735, partial [Spirochaetaceae bacterium]|nr:hypothetical protein [Spirochaetaceae bacterium]
LIESLTIDTLTSWLKAYKDSQNQIAFPDTFLENSYYGLLKNRDLNEAEYKNLMVKIKADPVKYREFFATILEDDGSLLKLEQERALYPDTSELTKIREDNKALRQANKKSLQTIDALNTKIMVFEHEESFLRGDIKRLNNALDHVIETEGETQKDFAKSAREEAKLQSDMAKEELKDTLKSAREEARESEKATKERIAAEHKEKFEDYKEAKRERKIAGKLIRAIMRKPAAMIDWNYVQQIKEIQSQYTVKRLSNQMGVKRLERLRNRLADPDLSESSKRNIERELNAKKSLYEMNIEQLTDLAEQIGTLARDGFNKRVISLIDKQKERWAEIKALNLENQTNKKAGTFGRIGTGKEYKGGPWETTMATTTDMRRMTDWMGKTAQKLLIDKVYDARNTELRNLNRRQEACKDKMSALDITVNDLASKVEIMGEEFTRDSLIGFYIALQNDDSLAAVLYGNLKNHQNPEAFFDTVDKTLTKNEKEFANWMIDSFSGEDKERLFQTYLMDKNNVPESILRYFPMFRRNIATDDYKYDSEINDDLITRSGRGRVYPNKNFTIARIHNLNPKNQTPISVSALSTYMKAIEMQEHYIAYMQLSKDLNYIFGKASENIILKYGRAWNDTIHRYISNVANPMAFSFRHATEKTFYKMISNAVMGSLMFNVSVALKQLSSLPLVFRDAGISGTIFSFANTVLNFNKVTDFAYEHSPILKNRNIDPFLKNLDIQINNPEAAGRTIAQIQKFGLSPTIFVDKFTVVTGWNAVYKKAMNKTGDHAQAVKAADNTILRTQAQGDAIHSPIMYQHGILRGFLTFTRSVNQVYQMLISDLPRAIADRNIKQITYDAIGIAIAGLYIAAISRQRLPDNEEEIIKDIASQIAIGLPLIGSELTRYINGEFFSQGGVQLSPVTITGEILKSVKTVIDTDKEAKQKLRAGLRALTEAMKAFGLPGLITWRSYRALEEENLRYVFFGRDREESNK